MVAVKNFGSFKGKRVDQFTLTSSTGVEVDIINWGVVVRDWRVPVKGGKRSVVLGFDKFDDYPAHSPHLGALAGRVANRIAGASFELDGKTYKLPANNGSNTLHGGPEGIGHLVWDAAPDDATNSVVFSLTSPDGAMGFPGTVKLKATYRLDGNKLRLELGGVTDRPTPLSLVQHQYFNLGTGIDVLDHTYWFAASAFTEVRRDDLIPTGNILEAAPGSLWNFRAPRTLRNENDQPLGYDGNLVLDAGRDFADPIAVVKAPQNELTLKLWSDRPGLQFYNALTTNIPVPGLGGKHYGQYSGFCLEDQAFPDALHHPHFPNIIVTPDKPYAHWCEFENRVTAYLALLRGIGPATHPAMPLPALAERCAAAGLNDVVNIGNTGNLVFASAQSQSAVEAIITEAVRSFGLANEVFTRTRRQLQMLVQLAPFPDAAGERPGKLGVCFFHKDPRWPEAYKHHAGPERLQTFSNHLIVDYGGQLSVSRLTVEKTVGHKMTQRNWSTILRLAEALKL